MTHQVRNWLQNKGWKLTEIGDCYIAESPTGKRATCNIRWKSKPVWGRRSKRWEWSVPLTAWKRYIHQGIQGMFVFEKSTGSIHFACLSELIPEARIYEGEDLDKGGTVFLPVSRYRRLATTV
jgi:hypothetical protein